MKKVMMIVSSLLVIGLFQFSSCSSDDNAPGPEQRYLERLSFTWNIQSATVDNKNVTNAFPNMSLTVKGDRSYTVSNAVSPIWPASGNFTLQAIQGSEHYTIKRNDGIDVQVTELSTNRLVLRLQYTPTGGRASSVGGNYEFVFTR